MPSSEPDPVPDDRPDQPVRGARWAHERVVGKSTHDRASRSGEPETAMRDTDDGSDEGAADR